MFLVDQFLAPRLNPKLEEQLLSAVRHCLINIFSASFRNGGRSCIRNLSKRHVVETRTHLLRSNCNKFKIYKLHELTLVGLGEAVLVNEVTIVVNCYGVGSPSPECCKNDLIECYCVVITLEFKYMNCFL